ATSFSPPHTRVVVGGEPVGSGFAIEIEDRGLGMSPEALREANRRIGESSGHVDFDIGRLGLFVVSRLARRHEIRVSLCPSAYGGITAVVLIPSSVMQPPGAGDEAAKPAATERPEPAPPVAKAVAAEPEADRVAPGFDDLDLDLELEFGLGRPHRRGAQPRPQEPTVPGPRPRAPRANGHPAPAAEEAAVPFDLLIPLSPTPGATRRR